MSSRHVVSYCRSKILQNAPREHSAILLTCISMIINLEKFNLFSGVLLSGCLRQVCLYVCLGAFLTAIFLVLVSICLGAFLTAIFLVYSCCCAFYTHSTIQFPQTSCFSLLNHLFNKIQHFVRPDLGPSCLKRLTYQLMTKVATSKERVTSFKCNISS